MPYIDIRELMQIAGPEREADLEIDLAGLSPEAARARIDETLRRAAPDACRVIFRFPPATEGSGETLFQPVGRHLLSLRRAGRIRRLEQLQDLGAGFYVELP